MAALRSWHDRYGAEVYYLGVSALELRVARPLQQLGEVAAVAIEQYAYCDDLGQVIGEPDQVARRQVPAGQWHFWLD